MHKDILEQLYKPFDLKARQGVGGKTFKYVPSDDIVDRMNKVFQGNWTTEVMEAKIIEDQILMRVRVTVTDPKNTDTENNWFFQEGYASQPIARYTFGDKKDQSIDIGNSYKSAMSKAIKTAVAKWGVALYLTESDNDGEVATPSPFQMPTASTKTVSAPNQENTLSGPPIQTNAPPVGNVPPSIPPVATEPKKVFDDAKIVDAPGSKAPPTDFSPISNGETNEDYLSPVQKSAIEIILSVNNLEFKDLLRKALGRTEDLPAEIDKIAYLDAVKIIQYGNTL